jgi:hypothetical protein
MPRHDKVKINPANGQTGEKIRSSHFVLTALISFGLFNIFHPSPPEENSTQKKSSKPIGEPGYRSMKQTIMIKSMPTSTYRILSPHCLEKAD